MCYSWLPAGDLCFIFSFQLITDVSTVSEEIMFLLMFDGRWSSFHPRHTEQGSIKHQGEY